MLTSCPTAACVPVLGPLLHWERLMASLAQLSTSWCRSSVKVPLPFWVWEAGGVGPVAWFREAEWFWQLPEPFMEPVALDPGTHEGRWNRKWIQGINPSASLWRDKVLKHTCGTTTKAGHGWRGSELLYGWSVDCLWCLCCWGWTLLWRGFWTVNTLSRGWRSWTYEQNTQ